MREFNLDRMMSYPRCAVLIQSEDDALEFLEYLRLRKKTETKFQIQLVVHTGIDIGMKRATLFLVLISPVLKL